MNKTKIRIGSHVHDLADEKLRDHVGYVDPLDTAGAPSLAYELSANGTYYIVTGRGTVTGSEIVIPDTHEGKPVLEVAENTFLNDTEITKFTLGKYIVYVGVGNIETLTNLTELYCLGIVDEDFVETLLSCGVDKYHFNANNEIGLKIYPYSDAPTFVTFGWCWDEDGDGMLEYEASSNANPTNVLSEFRSLLATCDNTDEDEGNGEQ